MFLPMLVPQVRHPQKVFGYRALWVDRPVLFVQSARSSCPLDLLVHPKSSCLGRFPTFRSPAQLTHNPISGIGPVDHLKEHQIPIRKDLSGVGSYLVREP